MQTNRPGVISSHILLCNSQGAVAIASNTSSQVLLSRGVAGLDRERQHRLEATAAPLVTILENPSIHILNIGPSQTSNVTRSYSYSFPPRAHFQAHTEMIHQDSPTMSGALTTPDGGDSPVRAQASPRSTPSMSAGSSFSFINSSQKSELNSPSSGEQSPIRGRALSRAPSTIRESARTRASTNLEAGARLFRFDNTLAYQRLLSRDLTAEPEDIFNTVVEPLPVGVERFRSSLSEELYRAATRDNLDDSIDLTRFGDHRDTFAILGLRHLQFRRVELPADFWQGLLQYIDYDTYLSVRLSCRCWSAAISDAHHLHMPPVASLLPLEILQNIYKRLDPVDFNAARHTCRVWMSHSQDVRQLGLMLKQGGWVGAALADRELLQRNRQILPENVNLMYLLSKRLATECSLRPDWTGNGLFRNPYAWPEGDYYPTVGLVRTSQIDFSELSNGYAPMSDGESGAGLRFTVSVCNKFLLVTEGCIIYIYSLRANWLHTHQPGGHLSPMTMIICPHRVLGVSMDTSSNRFAVAALLEGRVGIVYDIHQGSSPSETPLGPMALSDTSVNAKSPVYSHRNSSDHNLTEVKSPRLYGISTPEDLDRRAMYPSDRAMAHAIAERIIPDIHGASPVGTSRTLNDLNPTPVPPAPQILATFTNATYIPIENGPRSIYRNLCTAEVPPLSVAICPQRRCVAFGCERGIELHWVDALTGQDLSRWFPLTASSDFLYFLPSRPGSDSANKLRLISSACHPELKGIPPREHLSFEVCQVLLYLYLYRYCLGLNSFFWHLDIILEWKDYCRSIGFSDCLENTDGGSTMQDQWEWDYKDSERCDHFRAVPISDGRHILFTDPREGDLCLGFDGPPGIRAAALVRRYILVGPKDAEGKAIVPRAYKSGTELRWGTRVVVGYGERLWLFVIPPDRFAEEPEQTQSEREHQRARDEPYPLTPKRVDGVEFGRVHDLVDIAVDSTGGDLTVWAFAANGMAYVWQLGGGPKAITRRVVHNDGTVAPEKDLDGDTFMHGTFNPSKRAVQFDGSVSAPPTTPLDFGEQDRIIDYGDDPYMPPMASQEDEGYGSGAGEYGQAARASAIHAAPLSSADWIPDSLRASGKKAKNEDLVDVLELGRCEIMVLSAHVPIGGPGWGRWTSQIEAIAR